MTTTPYLDKLLPGFASIGFSAQLNDLVVATNLAAVRTGLTALLPKLTTDGVTGITATATAANLLTNWNLLCDNLNAASAITIKDYSNCKVVTLEDFGVKWKQLLAAVDREAALDRDYVALLGRCVVALHYH